MEEALIMLLLSCAAEPRPEVVDRNRYIEAAQASDVRSMLSLCGEIGREDLRGECILFAAKKAVEQRSDGLAVCEESPSESWLHACRFEVSDVAGMTGPEADSACSGAGRFRTRCLYHALQREENALLHRFPLGQEVELIGEIQRRMKGAGVEELPEEPLSQTLTARIIARRYLVQNRALPFDAPFCGQAPPSVCTDAYRFAIKLSGRGSLPSDCTLPMGMDRAAAAGLPVWAPAFAGPAQAAWQNLCSRSSGRGHRPPDHAASRGAAP
jgi:hypothetical protein